MKLTLYTERESHSLEVSLCGERVSLCGGQEECREEEAQRGGAEEEQRGGRPLVNNPLWLDPLTLLQQLASDGGVSRSCPVL